MGLVLALSALLLGSAPQEPSFAWRLTFTDQGAEGETHLTWNEPLSFVRGKHMCMLVPTRMAFEEGFKFQAAWFSCLLKGDLLMKAMTQTCAVSPLETQYPFNMFANGVLHLELDRGVAVEIECDKELKRASLQPESDSPRQRTASPSPDTRP